MMTWSNMLFYIIFLGQIFLLSYFLPAKLLGRMRSVLETYPPSGYPKLYVKPAEYYKIGQWVFKLVNRLILLFGFIILFAIVFVVDHATFADDGFISEAWPAAYGMIQFLPLMALEFLEFSQFKQMRKVNSGTTRKAELRPRRLFDFVSPRIVGMAVALYLAAILLDLYIHGFAVEWGHYTIQRTLVMSISNFFLIVIASWHLYGRKLDPHQSFEDRAKQISAILRSMLFVSMALSIYLMTAAVDDVFNLDFLDASLLSLYFQIIAFLSIGHMIRSLKIEDIDFEVYKNDTAVA